MYILSKECVNRSLYGARRCWFRAAAGSHPQCLRASGPCVLRDIPTLQGAEPSHPASVPTLSSVWKSQQGPCGLSTGVGIKWNVEASQVPNARTKYLKCKSFSLLLHSFARPPFRRPRGVRLGFQLQAQVLEPASPPLGHVCPAQASAWRETEGVSLAPWTSPVDSKRKLKRIEEIESGLTRCRSLVHPKLREQVRWWLLVGGAPEMGFAVFCAVEMAAMLQIEKTQCRVRV